MNTQRLSSLVDQTAKMTGVSHQHLYDTFFFERFLYHLSLSPYNSRFVLKGGFLLQTMKGAASRTTMDVDLKYVGVSLNEQEIRKIFDEICSMSFGDNVNFRVVSLHPILAQMKYPGLTVTLMGHVERTRSSFGVDLATGDVVIPSPIEYTYTSSIDKNSFSLLAYTIETILAEKFQTLISKGIDNSRSKDLYDIFLLSHQSIHRQLLHDAIVSTFIFRETDLHAEKLRDMLKKIQSEGKILERYQTFQSKHAFASEVSFEQTMEAAQTVFSCIHFLPAIVLNQDATFYFLRHGEDEQDKIGGWSDNHLTPQGEKESRETGELLSSYEIKKLYTSNLPRALETANIIASILKLEPSALVISHDLREMNNGDLANRTKEEVRQLYPGLFFNTLGFEDHYPHGESPKEFFERTRTALISLLNRPMEGNTVVVTHGGIIGILMSLVYGVRWDNTQKYIIPHCRILQLTISKGIPSIQWVKTPI